ncbi:hypothetical protein GLOIN_2v1480022 [Rhizophagus irregularis DAOM 181602=DAOM 197198]|uniref:Uncharacterized protein n=1 Tax=Rhizophagus irregularis (strain DAOM 181602 / DAOM 197198 / MUCL 43194) TaxID=747089 RepID=A0A2P4PVN6_RHIID|nr:hypothetical protein GLOIN_2v1480022 [Rhizophagus irregularis DAOM 181602=DAOM 197198]POG69463.1 hypothetical protein GLOIN_2v1480022 [Rhizophagus irregularis DAOM 181602=DAOM 197198]|eukprot:XP_025176329.1 hypothetical protein GLOIN_2v1480022 [Rhizophagus irregularis DAOM 181602=DAOM 197198]
MKQKNGNQYSASSVRCAIAAIHHHIMKNSTISGINIHDQATFPAFWEVTNGKLKFFSDLGLNDAKEFQEITTNLNISNETSEFDNNIYPRYSEAHGLKEVERR